MILNYELSSSVFNTVTNTLTQTWSYTIGTTGNPSDTMQFIGTESQLQTFLAQEYPS